MRIRNGIGALWGPTCAAIKWAFNGIVIPSLSFGSLVWSRVCNDSRIIQKLSRINRLAAACMIPFRKGTPSAALEIILDMPPLDLVIKQKALSSMLRVLHHNRSKLSRLGKKGIGNIRYLQNNLWKMGIDNKVFNNENALSIKKDLR